MDQMIRLLVLSRYHNNVRNMQGKVMPNLDDVVKSYQNGEVYSMSKADNILLNNNNNNNNSNNNI